jgi:hypothetical protein
VTEPEDTTPDPVETEEYWLGYWNGKKAAMDNLAVVYSTHRDLSVRLERRESLVWTWFWLSAAVATAGFFWNLALGSPPWWMYLGQGTVLGTAWCRIAYVIGRRS